MTNPATIDPRPDGPLQVSGGITLCNSSGATVATDAKFWLCRCGGSANKPFCDGSHKKLGFTSARESDPSQRDTTDHVGKHLTIHDNRSLCAHAGHCTEHSAGVFSMDAEPWIDADAESAEQTIATIQRCPSGALAYSVDGVLQEHSGRAPGIRIAKDGPYEIVGGATLLGADQPQSSEHYTLCRCGQSKNKPFCDGSHWAAGFKDEKN